MGTIRIPLIGGPWDGSHANVPPGSVPADPYRVEVRESSYMHFYILETHLGEDGIPVFQYHYDRAEKMSDQSGD